MLRAWPGDLPELTAEQAKQIIPRVEHTGPLKIAKRSEATGPQRSDSGAPNPFPDLITIELTKEEAEYLLTDATPDRRGGWKVAADADMKLRAALKEAAP